MGKKSKSKGAVSKGVHSSVDPKLAKQVRQARTTMEKYMLALRAWEKGKPVKKLGFKDWAEARNNRYRMKGA